MGGIGNRPLREVSQKRYGVKLAKGSFLVAMNLNGKKKLACQGLINSYSSLASSLLVARSSWGSIKKLLP
jgi:hypothetical protein